MKRLACLAPLALCLLAGMARAQPPLSPESDSDAAGLGMQMAKVEDDIRTSSALIGDPALNATVRAVACRVAAAACPALRLYIVEAPGFNIAALPNGALIVWSGALLRAGSEAQLAHLLGHEIAHSLHQDSLAQFHRMVDTSSVVAVLGVAASGVGIDFVGTPASLAALDAHYAHSQSEEEAADSAGFGLATDAGYEPQAAVAAADLEKSETLFARVHPQADGRQARLQALADAVPHRAYWKTGVESWHVAMAPYQERWTQDELQRGTPGDGVTLFTRLGAADPARALFRYALGEAYRKRGQPGDAALAGAAFRGALALPDPPPLAWRGLGLMAMQDGDRKAAHAAFARYRTAAPNADEAAMIDYYMAQL